MFILTSRKGNSCIVYDSLSEELDEVSVSDVAKAVGLGIKIIGVEIRNGTLRLMDNVSYFNKLKMLESSGTYDWYDSYRYKLNEYNLILLKNVPYKYIKSGHVVIDKRVNRIDTITFSGMSGKVKISGGNSLLSTSYMFNDWHSMTDLDLSDFDTSSVKSMSSMFECCSSLRSLDLSNFNINDVRLMNCMFTGCKNLQTLKLWRPQPSSVINMARMFDRCISLQKLDTSVLNSGVVEDTAKMFKDCVNLREIDLSNLDLTNLVDASNMFNGCKSLRRLNINKIPDSSNTKDMFLDCSIGAYSNK